MSWNFQEKNPGLSMRRGNPVQIYWNILEHTTSLFTDFGYRGKVQMNCMCTAIENKTLS